MLGDVLIDLLRHSHQLALQELREIVGRAAVSAAIIGAGSARSRELFLDLLAQMAGFRPQLL